MYSFLLALLLVTINASPAPTQTPRLTPIPTANVAESPLPTSNEFSGSSPVPTTQISGDPSPSPTKTPGNVPTFNVSPVPTPPPSTDGSGLSPVPTTQSMGEPSPSPTKTPVNAPGMTPTRSPTPSPINGALSRCMETGNLLDIVFIVDSSGSVWDDGYKNWENELQLVSDIISDVIPLNSRVGLINFSGCGTSYSYIDCVNQNRLKHMISLNDNGTPNDLDAVLSTVDAIDEDDFLGGYTWTNEALGLALTEFADNSAADTDKIIILITDGAPYPTDQGHEPCKTSTGYVSPTLQALWELGVAIVTVGIDINEATKREYFDCISGADFYFQGTFDSNSYTSSPTASNSNSGMNVPTFFPTPSPVSKASTITAIPTQTQGLSHGDSSLEPTIASGSSISAMPTASQEPTTQSIGEPSPSPTRTPGSSGTVPTPRPTATPWSRLTPIPTIDIDGSASSQEPTAQANGVPSLSPSPSPSPSPTRTPGSPGTVPTPRPIAGGMNAVPTFSPTPSPVMAVEDLSDSIGDFICDALGTSRMIIPTAKPTPMPVGGGNNNVPTMIPTPSPIGSLQGICEAENELDIVFMIDSSGSVYDDGFNNWQSQLDLVHDIVDSLPATSTRVSLINFSGCGQSFSLDQCQTQGRLHTVFNLNTYNDLEMVSSRIEEMDSDDFKGGFTWTNEALGLALNQFYSYSVSDREKIVVLLTDGEPYPYNDGHEPCLTSTNYKSDTLIALNTLNVDIITVGIDISGDVKEEKLDCLSESYFGVSQFSTLDSLSVQIAELICNKVDGDFTKLSLAPTSDGTEPSIKPTPSPTTSDEQGPITSNDIMANIYINLAIISGLIGYLLF